MKMHCNRAFAVALVASATLTVGAIAPASAATLDQVFGVAKQVLGEAKNSQTKIDTLTDETRELLGEYKTVLKEIDGLKVYNRQLDKQIATQNNELAQLAASIDKVTVIERQITPLMLRMIDGLEQFIELDVPFLLEERRGRIERLRDILDEANVAVSEKFSQVLNAYQIENDYGRSLDAVSSKIEFDGKERVVDVLRVGRVALMFQTQDGETTGVWDHKNRQWVALPDSPYQTQVRNGIRMARKQLSIDVLLMPIAAPEAAQ